VKIEELAGDPERLDWPGYVEIVPSHGHAMAAGPKAHAAGGPVSRAHAAGGPAPGIPSPDRLGRARYAGGHKTAPSLGWSIRGARMSRSRQAIERSLTSRY
jgi:hypothetical protein